MSILGTIAFIIVFLTIGTLAAAVVTILPGVPGVPGGLVAGAMRKSAAGRLTGILIAVACQSYVALAFAAIVIESARPITGKTTGVWQWFLWALAVFLVEDEKLVTGDLACGAERKSAEPAARAQRKHVQPLVLELTSEGGFALGNVDALDDLTRSGAEAAAEFHP